MERRLELDRWGRGGSLNDHGAGARARIAPGVSRHVVDGIGRHVRCVYQNISRENTVDKYPVREIITLVVVHDCAKVVVGIPDVDRCGVVALDVDRWGSGRSGNPPLDRSAARP